MLALLLTLEFVAIVVCVELLMWKLPAALQLKSRENCQRMDGTISSRRQGYEARARSKLRRDLWATFLIVAIPGNVLLGFVHMYVIELPTAVNAALAFRLDPAEYRDQLMNSGVAKQDFVARKSRTRSRKTAEESQRMLWHTWPACAGLAICWLFGSCYAIRIAHRRALHDYAEGLVQRSDQYTFTDIGRLAG